MSIFSFFNTLFFIITVSMCMSYDRDKKKYKPDSLEIFLVHIVLAAWVIWVFLNGIYVVFSDLINVAITNFNLLVK